MEKDLRDPIAVPFAKIYLDPNNPRIATTDRPGYEDPDVIFDDTVQSDLKTRMKRVYDVTTLESAITAQGWVPIDAILVWEHPKKKGHYIVVEGNTRTIALREIRDHIATERAKLARMEAKKTGYTKADIEEQQRKIDKLAEIISDTDPLLVFPLNARTVSELERKLPRLLGVRHVTHAQQWSPYAQNLYVLSLYERLFAQKHGEGKDLRIESGLVQEVGTMVSLGETKTRRNIQAASAFSHFKREYEDQLPEGEQFTDEDQYFFELLLQNEYPRQQFGLGKEDLRLSPEIEGVLFKWAFAQPRNQGEENPNIFYKAENIRLWNQMKRYDDAKGTAFATRLNVEDPDTAVPVKRLEAEYLAHKAQVSPLDAISSLLQTFKNLRGETLMSQASHIVPMLEEVARVVDSYRKMLEPLTPSRRR